MVPVRRREYGQCNGNGWTDITQVAPGSYHTVGLNSDGTLVTVGPEVELAKWDLSYTVPQREFTIAGTAGGLATASDERDFYPRSQGGG